MSSLFTQTIIIYKNSQEQNRIEFVLGYFYEIDETGYRGEINYTNPSLDFNFRNNSPIL
jgi:hypothetical protein